MSEQEEFLVKQMIGQPAVPPAVRSLHRQFKALCAKVNVRREMTKEELALIILQARLQFDFRMRSRKAPRRRRRKDGGEHVDARVAGVEG